MKGIATWILIPTLTTRETEINADNKGERKMKQRKGSKEAH